jgi:D-alanine transaminase
MRPPHIATDAKENSMTVYLNGEFMAREQAKISPLDRGFIFGDGVYEVIPAYDRRPFRLPRHLARLEASLAETRIPNPHDARAWSEIIAQLVARNPWDNQGIYLQVTRGVAPRDHVFPAKIAPTVFMMCNPLATPSPAAYEQGLNCVSAVDNRWLRCNIKSTSLLGNVLLRQTAADAGAAECVLFRDGFLTEASACNVLAVKNGVLLAPPRDNLILHGITYDVVLELARDNAIPLELRRIAESEVRGADELWLTSTTKEVMAVTTLDGQPVGQGVDKGKPGPMFRRMYKLFQECKAAEAHAPAHA